MPWSEGKSMASLGSSRSEASTLLKSTKMKWRNTPLHERLNISDMINFKDIFRQAYGGKISFNEFRNLLRTQLNLEYDDEEYNLLFMKINVARNKETTWDEFISHLILGYFRNDPENQRGHLQLPIMGVPIIMRSQHRQPITKICFSPNINKDRTKDPMQGNYMTASRDGMINWWSLDMRLLRTAFSASPEPKKRGTWVTDMVCMPDISIVVTSSTERDLRFYDCTAKTFTLKMIITSWEHMICSMHYHFHKDINEKSLLICGDVGGSVRLLVFSPIERGPFRNEAGKALIQLRHVDLQKKPEKLPQLRLIEYERVHPEWVRQVSFYASLHCVVSCATCPDSLLMMDVEGSKTSNMFRVEMGIQCFNFDEESHLLVTGGPDCTVRVWNSFVPNKANTVFQGHHAGIINIVLQDHGQKIYSFSRDRVIKVWDLQTQCCLQTYIDIPSHIGERNPISTYYNGITREYILGANKIAMITLDEQLNCEHTDGSTHSRAVSKILYNPLFKVIITCGLDSIIMCWDPLTGSRNSMVRDAHTLLLHGELIPVEITAACFDPGYQLLLTGARNGTLKVWNFNTGQCLRNMGIEHMCEVTNVFWVEGRILAIGWNRHVTEFEDTGTATTGKAWETRHTDDVLAAAARVPLTLITTSYNSELLMWKLETGQPYRQYTCTDPMLRIKMRVMKQELNRPSVTNVNEKRSSSICVSKSSGRYHKQLTSAEAIQKAKTRQNASVHSPGREIKMRPLAVHAVICLDTRPVSIEYPSFFVSVETGQIQCWSDHSAGGYKGSFQAVHTAGDYVSAMATDVNNDYLLTGTTVGYVKVYLMTNYMRKEEVHINLPALRLKFPFLLNDRVEGRAKRFVRDQPLPLLLNSYRAHLRSITSIVYIDELEQILTGSSDYSVRVWTLGGQYLQTLGSSVPRADETRFPPDVKKVASFTTLKVWRSGEVSRYTPGQKVVDKLKDITELELRKKTFGAPPPEPILGHYFRLPQRADRQDPIILDDTLDTIPVYAHLRMASIQPIKRPDTPQLVRDTRIRRVSAEKQARFSDDEHQEQQGRHHTRVVKKTNIQESNS